MKYKEWKYWVRSKPWLLRWFIYLVLLRPVVDNLYYLKHISPFLSPLYIVGVLTPILALLALSRKHESFRSPADKIFRSWSVMVLITTVFILIYHKIDLALLANALKFAMPFFLFFFLRLFVRHRRDIDGLIQTFLYSLAIVLVLFFYELTFGPIKTTESRGLTRIQGNFGDVFNYGLYICFGLLFIAYRKMKEGKIRIRFSSIFRLSIALLIGVLVLLRINHAASLIVFSTLLFFYAYYQSHKNLLSVFSFLIIGVILFQTMGDRLLEESITPLFERDMQALSGEINQEQLFHGRYGRWQYYWDFFTAQSIPGQLLGSPIFYPDAPLFLSTGSGSHNDYVRIGMYTGILGLFFYLFFHLRLFFTTRRIPLHDRFLVTGSLAIIALYSITLTPTLYSPVLYMTYATFAWIIRQYQSPALKTR